MQTSFTLAQLADPEVANAETILRSCVHCGFCTATCPTYVLLGDELDSPRGRIYLIKDMLEAGAPASAEVTRHIDRCLSCLACMTTCPSGVDYMHLVDHARAHIERTYRRPLVDRLIRRTLAAVLPYPGRFRLALGRDVRSPAVRAAVQVRSGVARLAPMLALTPARLPPRGADRPARLSGERRARMRVALLRGCAQRSSTRSINEATIRLLTRCGVRGGGGRGRGLLRRAGPPHGPPDDALAAARPNRAWRGDRRRARRRPGHNTSGCGTTVKDYGFMLRHDPAYAEKAARISALATRYLRVSCRRWTWQGAANGAPALKVAYHAACSLQHGQQVKTAPKTLLTDAGFDVREPAEAHLCCGSAGTYNMLQPDLSARCATQGRQPRRHRGRCGRRRQHRLSDPNRPGHRRSRRPHRSTSRLGIRRPATGAAGRITADADSTFSTGLPC